jgi:hypothetical protein
MNALQKQLAALLKLKQQAQARGQLMQTVAIEAPVESDPDRPPTQESVVGPLFDYLYAIRKLPRPVLEARYRKDIGEDCPALPRELLVEKMARTLQTRRYLEITSAVPERVQRNDRDFERRFAMCAKYGVAVGEEDESDEDEPNKADRAFDPLMRARALVGNPFERGKSWGLFQLVAGQPAGIQYNALVLLLEKLYDWPRVKAEGKAQKVFTKWVEKRWVELV